MYGSTTRKVSGLEAAMLEIFRSYRSVLQVLSESWIVVALKYTTDRGDIQPSSDRLMKLLFRYQRSSDVTTDRISGHRENARDRKASLKTGGE